MDDALLKAIQDRVQSLQYVMTLHAEEEMDDDGLTVFDVEQVILTGQITDRQRDAGRGDLKYLIEGWTVDRQRATVVAKLGPAASVVIITVFRV